MIASLSHPSRTARAAVGHSRAPTGMFMRLVGHVSCWWRTYRDRQALASLNGAMLRDIGLTRADVERELLQPFWLPIDYRSLDEQRRHAVHATPKGRGQL